MSRRRQPFPGDCFPPTRWELEVDPEGILPYRERYRRAEAARAASYVAQGLKARQRNRERKAAEAGHARPAPPTAEERRLQGRLGGLIAASRRDPHEATEAARAGYEASFAEQVDPDGVLEPAERARRAKAARAAWFATLSLRSVEARERKRKRERARHPLDMRPAPDATATKRRLGARIGAYRRLATHDPHDLTKAARDAGDDRLRERLGVPDTGTPPEREEAFRKAKSEYFRELAKRRKRREPEPSGP